MDRIENSAQDRLPQEPPARGWRDRMRWSGCFALAAGIHVTVAAALLAHWPDEADAVWSAPAITVDLAPAPAAPTLTQTELPPGPVTPQQEAQPQPAQEKPVEKAEKTPEPVEAQPVEKIPEPEKLKENSDTKAEPLEKINAVEKPQTAEKKIEEPKQQKHKNPHRKLASLASAPSSAEHRAERAAAPAPGASAHNSNAVPNWKSRLVAWLERYKRYPSEAQSRGDHGVAQLAFSIDRSGGVHHARILHSSGSRLLDAATLSLVERAAPLPPPPQELPSAQIAIVVPIKYNVQ